MVSPAPEEFGPALEEWNQDRSKYRDLHPRFKFRVSVYAIIAANRFARLSNGTESVAQNGFADRGDVIEPVNDGNELVENVGSNDVDGGRQFLSIEIRKSIWRKTLFPGILETLRTLSPASEEWNQNRTKHRYVNPRSNPRSKYRASVYAIIAANRFARLSNGTESVAQNGFADRGDVIEPVNDGNELVENVGSNDVDGGRQFLSIEIRKSIWRKTLFPGILETLRTLSPASEEWNQNRTKHRYVNPRSNPRSKYRASVYAIIAANRFARLSLGDGFADQRDFVELVNDANELVENVGSNDVDSGRQFLSIEIRKSTWGKALFPGIFEGTLRTLSLLGAGSYKLFVHDLSSRKRLSYWSSKMSDRAFWAEHRSAFASGLSQLSKGYKCTFKLSNEFQAQLGPADFTRLAEPIAHGDENERKKHYFPAILEAAINSVVTVVQVVETVQVSLCDVRCPMDISSALETKACADTLEILREIVSIFVGLHGVGGRKQANPHSWSAFEHGLPIFSALIVQKASVLSSEQSEMTEWLKARVWRWQVTQTGRQTLMKCSNSVAPGESFEFHLFPQVPLGQMRREHRKSEGSNISSIKHLAWIVAEYSGWMWEYGGFIRELLGNAASSAHFTARVAEYMKKVSSDSMPSRTKPRVWEVNKPTLDELFSLFGALQGNEDFDLTKFLIDRDDEVAVIDIPSDWEAPMPALVGGLPASQTKQNLEVLRRKMQYELHLAARKENCVLATIAAGIMVFAPLALEAHLWYDLSNTKLTIRHPGLYDRALEQDRMNLIVIRVVDRKLLLSVTLRSNSQARHAPPVEFRHPFSYKALNDIRWYLEDFLEFPYGINPQKAKRVVEKMKTWGIELFHSIFESSSKAVLLYQEAVRDGLDKCEINVSSNDPKILKLPWELLHDPERTTLALSLAGMSRSLDKILIRAPLKPLPGGRLNILMVTSRPSDMQDAAYGMVARPVLDSIKHLGNRAYLKFLRPPTFEALGKELANNRGEYHVVHFDGHGGFDERKEKKYYQFGGPPGGLLFETVDGGSQAVSPERISQILQNNGIPLFVINACRSGKHGGDAIPSVASQLVNTGANAVVAMAYSAYGEAVRAFMRRFYDALVAGRSVSEAVGLGRKEIQHNPKRPSPRGDMSFEDWMGPVLYQQQKCALFELQGGSASALVNSEVTQLKLVDFPHVGRYGFIGRELDMLRLEKCYRKHEIVVLQSMEGTGKTELACGFGRWLLETNGRSQAFYISFEHGARLVNVVNKVGRVCMGEKCNQYSSERRQRIVTEYLLQNECLLVFDNFESVSGCASGTESLLTEVEQAELSEFLANSVGGKSWALITSRGEEEWLGCQRRMLKLGGLNGKDVFNFAKEVFAQADIDVKDLPSEYLDLLKMLNGHPLSLQVVLPRLKIEAVKEVMAGLESSLKEVDIDSDERNKSLSASLKYSFDKLSPRVKQHLPFLRFSSGRVDAKLLGAFSCGSLDAEHGEVYRGVFNDALDGDAWVEALSEAASSGIVETIGQGLFRIHSTLPWLLRQQLVNALAKMEKSETGPEDDFERLEAQFIRFYRLVADDLKMKLIANNVDAALSLDFEEPNLLRQLHGAEQFCDWESARLILQALRHFYQQRNRDLEYVALRKRGLESVGRSIEAAKSKGQDAVEYWVFLLGEEANDLANRRKLEKAEKIYVEMLNESIELNNQHWIANQYYQLGRIAQERREVEKAKELYEKSLKIGDPQSSANSYAQLGNLAKLQSKLVEAEKLYQKSLEIFDDGGDIHASAVVLHNLGIVKQDLGKLEDAKQLFLMALEIRERMRDSRLAAADYSQLGVVTLRQGQVAEAKEFCEKALKIYEDEILPVEEARELHSLGLIAIAEAQVGEAITLWWRSWGNYVGGNSEDEARDLPGDSLADLLAEIGEDKFKEIWRENIEEECQDSFMEILKSIKAKSIDDELRELSDKELKEHSDYLGESGEVEFKSWFVKKFKTECPQWHLKKLISLAKAEESLPDEESSEAAAGADQAGEAPALWKCRCLNNRRCVLQ